MGTKNNPGVFDCYAKAAPDEPYFILLGRDRHAELLVRLWALLREKDGEPPEVVAEARACATAMADWLRMAGRRQLPRGVLHKVMADVAKHVEAEDRQPELRL